MDTPIAVPRRLSDLVEYQSGSVVSRVILRSGGGVLTLFAFAEGEGLTEHSTPSDATVFVLEGSARIVIGGQEHEVLTGESLHLPASVPHTLVGGPPFKMLLTLLKTGGTGS